jgi:UDP-2,3-diacylglucosamine hydrolase
MADLSDAGIPVHVYIGNHDMWMFDYLPQETGVCCTASRSGARGTASKFLIGHGDGLGPGDRGYKFIKKVFRNPVMQWCFARLHPNLGLGFAHFWSGRSRMKNYENDRQFLGADKEWLAIHCREVLRPHHYDCLHLRPSPPAHGPGRGAAEPLHEPG